MSAIPRMVSTMVKRTASQRKAIMRGKENKSEKVRIFFGKRKA